MLRVQQRSRASAVCSLCRDTLNGLYAETCTGCETRFHSECFGELGGCPTLGCTGEEPAPTRQRPRRPDQPLSNRAQRAIARRIRGQYILLLATVYCTLLLSPVGGMLGYTLGKAVFGSSAVGWICGGLGGVSLGPALVLVWAILYGRPGAGEPGHAGR